MQRVERRNNVHCLKYTRQKKAQDTRQKYFCLKRVKNKSFSACGWVDFSIHLLYFKVDTVFFQELHLELETRSSKLETRKVRGTSRKSTSIYLLDCKERGNLGNVEMGTKQNKRRRNTSRRRQDIQHTSFPRVCIMYIICTKERKE